VLAHRFRLPSGLRRFAHRATSARFQTRVARRRTIGSGKSGSPVKRIAFRRVVPRSSATSARPRRFLPSAVIPSKMVSQRLDRLCCVRRQQSFSSRPLCARSERQVEGCSFPCKAALFRRSATLSLSRESSFRSMEGSLTGVPDCEPAPWYRFGTRCIVLSVQIVQGPGQIGNYGRSETHRR
jgi:hypothetical protein